MRDLLQKEKVTLIILFLVIFTKSVFASRLGFSLIDEGEYLHNTLRILDGQLPYKDFFSYQPPLYNYWNILSFKLFGLSVFSARLLNSIMISVATVILFLIARKFASNISSFIFALTLPFMELSMERLYYHVFTFIALYIFFTPQKTVNRLYTSGVLLGIVSLFRIDVGVLYFLG